MNELLISLQRADEVCAQTEVYFDRIDDLQKKRDIFHVGKINWKRVIPGFILFVILIGVFAETQVFSSRAAEILFEDTIMILGIALFFGVRKLKKVIAGELDRRIAVERTAVNKIFDENYDAVSFLPEEYWYPMATSYMVKAAACGRVTTIGEALDSFDAYLHRKKVEQFNADFLSEQQMQTAHLKSIRRSNKVNAAANITNTLFNIANNI